MDKKIFKIGFIVGGVIAIIIASVIYFKVSKYTEEMSKQLEDIALNEVEVYNLNGDTVSLNQYNGQPLIVNFWATWCGPCIRELPHFEEVKKELGDEINFVMISDERTNKIAKFIDSKPYSFPFLKSKIDLSAYGITSIPRTYLYSSQGKLITKHAGSLDAKKLKKLIEEIR